MIAPQNRSERDDPQAIGGSSRLDAYGWKRGIYRFAYVSGLTKIARSHYAGSGSLLMFHEVQDEVPVGLTGGISPRFFEDFLTWLRAQGWNFVSLGHVLRWQARPFERFVCLTFDDGHRDFLINALPILERHGIPFVLYIPTAAITRD